MTHLIVLFHTIDHQEEHHTNFSNSLEFEAHTDIGDCSICDVYLDVDFSELQSTSYSFVITKCISDQILQQEDQFKPVVLYLKQSRSPPYFIV